MHSRARSMTEQRPCAAVIRKGTAEEDAETAAAFPAASWKPKSPDPNPHIQHAFPDLNYKLQKRRGHKDIEWEALLYWSEWPQSHMPGAA